MKEDKKVEDAKAEETKKDTAYKLRMAKKAEKKANFVKEMNASSTFGKLWIWLKHKWFASILFWCTLIVTGTVLIIAGRILWEVAKMVFSISL